MDLNVIKQRLNNIQAESAKRGEKKSNNKDKYWKPSIGKAVIRVVPSKFYPENPFKEVALHYGIDKPVMISPTNFGEKDPIVEFAKVLRQEPDSDNWKLAKKLDPKVRIFIPVIVRGEEDKGVRLWQFGKLVFEEFLQLATDEEVGDFTDVLEGRDIKLTTVGPDVTGTAYNRTSISPSMKTSPLSTDVATVQLWLENQSDPVELFNRYSFEDMKASLDKHLIPDAEKESEDQNEIKKEEGNYSLNTTSDKVKESKLDKFDSLFQDDSDKVDDLPF